MWVTSAATIMMDAETEVLTIARAAFSVAVQVKLTFTTVWMRVKIAYETGFWLTMEMMVVEVVERAEQERARGGEASRRDLKLTVLTGKILFIDHKPGS